MVKTSVVEGEVLNPPGGPVRRHTAGVITAWSATAGTGIIHELHTIMEHLLRPSPLTGDPGHAERNQPRLSP